MDKVIHPISGEVGYFATQKEKELIDVAVRLLPQCVSSCSSECDVND